MSTKGSQYPYQPLGNQLKKMRIRRRESLAEVSGAVEIDVELLTGIEQGKKRPTEDILLLLISYFSVKEDEATKLWEMAGYDQVAGPSISMVNDVDSSAKNAVMVMPMDARIVYTDMMHVMINNFGVVLNFMQTAGPNNQPLAVARIGMSKEHAKSVLEVLQSTLQNSEAKALPAPEDAQTQPPEKSD